MIELYNMDNMIFDTNEIVSDVVFADCIYENEDFSWIDKYWATLKEDGVFIVMTDYHTVFDIGYYLKHIIKGHFVNHLAWKNEWGNYRKDRFRQSHDDIIIFSKGKNYKFYPDRIQVSKATAGSKGLNKSGRKTKLATSVIIDICLTTVAKERIKNPETGKLIQWQKPIALINRLLLPFTDEGDLIIDPFLGSGTTGDWAKKNNRSFIGIEYDKTPYDLSVKRIYG